MENSTSRTTLICLSIFAFITVAISLSLKTFTPAADIFLRVDCAQLAIGIFFIKLFEISYHFKVDKVRETFLFGILCFMIVLSNTSVLSKELTDCRSMTRAQEEALVVCQSGSNAGAINTASSLSINCALSLSSNAHGCVLSHITDIDNIDTAKSSGTAAAAFLIIQLLLVLVAELILFSVYWVPAKAFAMHFLSVLKKDFQSAASNIELKYHEGLEFIHSLNKHQKTN